jgi:hypothetical protein
MTRASARVSAEVDPHRAAIDALHAKTAIYTASAVVDDLLDRLGWPASDPAHLIDPSCGDGMFLARALDRLLAARPAGFEPHGLIEGWEIHPQACHDARMRVAGVFEEHGWPPARAAQIAHDMVHNRDFLTDGPTCAQWDIVAGNPPYLRAANVPPYLRKQYAIHVPDYAQSDMLHSFLDRCSRTVRSSGRIGLITSDRWLANASAARLREKLGERVAIAHLERLDVTTAFYRAKTRKAGAPPRIHPVAVVLFGAADGDAVGQRLGAEPIFPGVDVSRYAGLQTLGEFAAVRLAPWLGSAGVFVVDATAARRLPPECLVPAVDTDDIVGGKLRAPTRWAIRTSPHEEPCREVMQHLESQMHRMAARGRRGKFWMPPESFHAMDLSRESLLVPRIATGLKAIHVPPGVLPINHNLSIVAGTDAQLERVEQALARPLAQEWVRDYAARLENGYYSLTTTMLRKLPVSGAED